MAACGEDGVVKLLQLFRQEIATAMALMGVTSIDEIDNDLIEEA
jgi:isopentenyl diphosphate isomerase/L-lactate dehydrogenase-like FMN-dependent dehydrogenase